MSAILVEQVLPVVVSAVLVPLLSYLGLLLSQWLAGKIKHEAARELLQRLTQAALVAVQEAAQASVDAAKQASKDGKLSAEQAQAAKAAALEALRAHVSTQELARVLGVSEEAAERVQEAHLEAAVAEAKRRAGPRVQQTTPSIVEGLK